MAFLDAHKCKMIAPSTIMPSHKPITTHGSVRAPENHCKLLSLKSFVRRADAVFVYSVTIDTKTINDIRPYSNANKLPIRVSRYIWLRRCPFHLFVHIYFASHLIFGVAAHAVCAVFISGHNCISQKNIIFSSNICPRLCVAVNMSTGCQFVIGDFMANGGIALPRVHISYWFHRDGVS